MKDVFDYQSTIFYNTANIYFDKLSEIYSTAGFQFAIAPVSSWHLNGRDKNFIVFR
ncbi:MAG: hypothetical protein HC808_19000 [Candidatus Competibacteraceae bacterium]|nr:hypothetical protein [Candidatus Competibacteraceae bacterium]